MMAAQNLVVWHDCHVVCLKSEVVAMKNAPRREYELINFDAQPLIGTISLNWHEAFPLDNAPQLDEAFQFG